MFERGAHTQATARSAEVTGQSENIATHPPAGIRFLKSVAFSAGNAPIAVRWPSSRSREMNRSAGRKSTKGNAKRELMKGAAQEEKRLTTADHVAMASVSSQMQIGQAHVFESFANFTCSDDGPLRPDNMTQYTNRHSRQTQQIDVRPVGLRTDNWRDRRGAAAPFPQTHIHTDTEKMALSGPAPVQ